MRRVVAVLLEGGVGDFLVVRVVLELAGGDGHGGHVGLAAGAGFQVGVGDGRGARHVERQNRLVEFGQQLAGGTAREVEGGDFLRHHRL